MSTLSSFRSLIRVFVVTAVVANAAWSQPGGNDYAERISALQGLASRDDVFVEATQWLGQAAEAEERNRRAMALAGTLTDGKAPDPFVLGVLSVVGRAGDQVPLATKIAALDRALEGRFATRDALRLVIQRFQPRASLLARLSRRLDETLEPEPLARTVWLCEQLVTTDYERRQLIVTLIGYLEHRATDATAGPIGRSLTSVSLQRFEDAAAWRAWLDRFSKTHREGFTVQALHDEARDRWLEELRKAIRYLASQGDLGGILPYLDAPPLGESGLRELAARQLFSAAGLDKQKRSELVRILSERLPRIDPDSNLERILLDGLPPLAADARSHHPVLIGSLLPVLVALGPEPTQAELDRAMRVVRVLVSCTGNTAVPVARAAYQRLVGHAAAAPLRRELVAGLDLWGAESSDLVLALQDGDPSVRSRAGNALGLRRDPSLAPAIGVALGREANPVVQASLAKNIETLGAFDDPGTVQALIALLAGESTEILARRAAFSALMKALGQADTAERVRIPESLLKGLSVLQDEESRLALLAKWQAPLPAEVVTFLGEWARVTTGQAEARRIVELLSGADLAPEVAIDAVRQLAAHGVWPELSAFLEAVRGRLGSDGAGDAELFLDAKILAIELRVDGADAAELDTLLEESKEVLLSEAGRARAAAWWVRARIRGRKAKAGAADLASASWKDYREALKCLRTAEAVVPLDLRAEAIRAALVAGAVREARDLLTEDGAEARAAGPLAGRFRYLEAWGEQAVGNLQQALNRLNEARSLPGAPAAAELDGLDLRIALSGRDPVDLLVALGRGKAMGASNGGAQHLPRDVVVRLERVAAMRELVALLDRAQTKAESTAAWEALTADEADSTLVSAWLTHDTAGILAMSPPRLDQSWRRLEALKRLHPEAEVLADIPAADAAAEAHQKAWERVHAWWTKGTN